MIRTLPHFGALGGQIPPIERLLFLLLLLSLAGYFLLPTGKANNFPTYLVAVVALLTVKTWWIDLRRSYVLIASMIVVAYLSTSILWSSPYYDEDVHSIIGNALLISFFMVAVIVCHVRAPGSEVVGFLAMVAAASISALVFLVARLFVGEEIESAPLGRWTTPSIGAIGYGLALMVAILILVSNTNQGVRLFCIGAVLILSTACITLNVNYVFFALFSGLTMLLMGQVWENRFSLNVLPWMIACFLSMIAAILALNVVIDSGRQMIWSSVLDLVYNERLTLGFGIRSRPGFHIDCNIDAAIAAADCAFRHPHNIYISTLFYGGVIGFSALFLLMMTGMNAALEFQGQRRWLIGSLLTFGFAVLMFDGNRLISKINFQWLVFWYPLALAASLEVRGRMAERSESSLRSPTGQGRRDEL